MPQFKCSKSKCSGRIDIGSTNCPVCGRYFGIFGQHSSDSLVRKYCQIRFQGQNPRAANVIFIGRDPNFAEALADPQFEYIFNILLYYIGNGATFWENSDDPQYWKDNPNSDPRRKVHHPFLLPAYRRMADYVYHHNFSRLELDYRFAKYISFVEIVSVPTTGYPKNDPNGKLKSLTLASKPHIESIENDIFSGGKKGVFVSDTAICALGDFDRLSNFYQRIYNKRFMSSEGIPELLTIENVTIHKCYHFSDPRAKRKEHLVRLRELIKKYCNLTSGSI